MSKEDASSGLLSKVVKFVRNPATSWSDLDHKDASRDEALSKQLLKEMIERKRRNDFVRKREFDMLRKIRKQEASTGHSLTARPSFFQSSTPSKLDDRANTIKKIDEIEAQMSMQWWKTKNGHSTNDSVDGSSFSTSRTFSISAPPIHSAPFLVNALPGDYAITENAGLELVSDWAEKESGDLPKTSPHSVFANDPVPHHLKVARTSNQVSMMASGSGLDFNEDAALSDISPLSLKFPEGVYDAELEEASICFANGDDAGAEAGLLRMLAPNGVWIGHIETWMTLFDFYRATGQQDKFESNAIEFVQRFDRSAPQWFSSPEIVGQQARPVTPTNSPTTTTTVDWICPSTMSFQTVIALKSAMAKASMPWRVDWSNLKVIEADAVKPLCTVFNNWASLPAQLRFIGNAQLQLVIERAAPLNQRQIAQEQWYLRMAALRITHRPDEFELVALDFCVTYEVSPPAWEVARCDYKPLDLNEGASANHPLSEESSSGSVHYKSGAQDGDTEMAGLSQMDNLLSVELSGQIQGDAVEVLDRLEAKLMGANITMISCANLIRVDFSAAGTLLNWVSIRQAENRAVQFFEVNRLVAAFFNVIGITVHAHIFVRAD